MELDAPASIHGSCISVWATRAATGVPCARDAFLCGSANTFVQHNFSTAWSYLTNKVPKHSLGSQGVFWYLVC